MKLVFATLAFLLMATLVSLAQEPASQSSAKDETATQEKQEHKGMSQTKTVTGCLQKGDEPGEFSITGEDGKTWGLRSKTVKLEQHVGHKVTVTGSVHNESKAEEKKEGQMENAAGKEEYADLRVTSLKMVSDTCSK